MRQLFGFALPLGEGAPRPIDVRARTGVAAIEKQHAAPHVDRRFVLRREIVIQAGEEQLLDLRVVIGVGRGERALAVGAKQI